MKYFAEFDKEGNRISSYISDGMPYTEEDIQKKFPDAIEISEEDQILYITGEYIRDKESGKPVKKQPIQPSPDEIKERDLIKLDNEYQPQFLEITRAWANANMDGNTAQMETLKNMKTSLTDEYLAKKEVIEND